MIDFQTALDIAAIVAGISAGIVAAVAIIQSKMTQDQLKNTMRPWLGSIMKGISVDINGKLIVVYKNYGTLPALKVKSWGGVQLEPFTKEQLHKMVKGETDVISVLLPNAERAAYWMVPEYARVLAEKLT